MGAPMNCTRVTRWTIAFGVVAIWRTAAQPSPPSAQPPANSGEAPAPAIVPPRLAHDPGVSYPRSLLKQGRYEHVQIHLILELDVSGAVVGAKLEREASAPFAEAALLAAESLRFEPALRDGVPAPARIRFRYDLTPPPAALGGRVIDAGTGEPVSGARVPLELGRRRATAHHQRRWNLEHPGPSGRLGDATRGGAGSPGSDHAVRGAAGSARSELGPTPPPTLEKRDRAALDPTPRAPPSRGIDPCLHDGDVARHVRNTRRDDDHRSLVRRRALRAASGCAEGGVPGPTFHDDASRAPKQSGDFLPDVALVLAACPW